MAGIDTPILLDFPDSFETERLIIRAPRPGDGAAVNAGIRELIKELRPWGPWADPKPAVEDTESHLRGAAARFLQRVDLPLVVWRKTDGAFVGRIGLYRIDWSVPCMEIGYWVRTSSAGRATSPRPCWGSPISRSNTWAHSASRSGVISRNTRSTAVAERAGYTLEARFHHHVRGTDGNLRDTLIYVRFPE